MYVTGQEIEYSNGRFAPVVWAAHEGNDCADGHFVIQEGPVHYSLCYLDLNTDEEVWWYVDEGHATAESAIRAYMNGR